MATVTPYRVAGPCDISFDGKSLGVTQQGVIIRIRHSWQPITDDLHGAEPADFISTGKSVVVECVGMDVEKIGAAHPWLTALLKQSIEAKPDAGQLASSSARPLKITQRDSKVWLAPHAIAGGAMDLALSSVQESRHPLTFLIIPDADTGALFTIVPSYYT
jgi:hypothetical protein